MKSRSWLRLGPVAVLVLAPVLSLTGCAAGADKVSDPKPDLSAHPVVQEGQAQSVLDAVDGALVRGVDPKDAPNMVDARLVGPFQTLELAAARVAAQRKSKLAQQSQIQRLRLIVPVSSGWPRFFIAVGSSRDTSTPVLRVLTSATARAPYGLWAQTTMLPGATLPPTAPVATGSAVLGADAAGLVASPKEVLSGFAGYLNSGARTTASRPFRRSVYSDQLIQRLASDRKSLGQAGLGTVSSRHVVGPAGPLAVRTADGGALVIGELEQTYVIKIKKGKGHVEVTDQDLAALAGGKKQFSTSFTRTAVEVVVFSVPARGQGLITVIAAQKGDVKAVAK